MIIDCEIDYRFVFEIDNLSVLKSIVEYFWNLLLYFFQIYQFYNRLSIVIKIDL